MTERTKDYYQHFLPIKEDNTQHWNAMDVSSIGPTRGRDSNKMMAEVYKHVNQLPVSSSSSQGVDSLGPDFEETATSSGLPTKYFNRAILAFSPS
ncbi:hypothetical protein P5673_020645 [Acropora cervicornis]|uniref:Uncharacterized protein n=1 Tax=Acropora cervicornis TaxID=6130 RepID=A0AAD9V0V6_ACRCE|nr:hypothetical protein P5673_020645 [Acropora cervicornis]